MFKDIKRACIRPFEGDFYFYDDLQKDVCTRAQVLEGERVSAVCVCERSVQT